MENYKSEKNLTLIVEQAVNSFNRKEQYLIKNDLSERCICARFAMHLAQALENSPYSKYEVDIEYNRGADGKERAIKRLCNDIIVVDLVVHKRGYDERIGFDNLICIEMKKTSNRKGCDSDEKRLKNMTGADYGFCYNLGIMILIDNKQNLLRIKSRFCEGNQL